MWYCIHSAKYYFNKFLLNISIEKWCICLINICLYMHYNVFTLYPNINMVFLQCWFVHLSYWDSCCWEHVFIVLSSSGLNNKVGLWLWINQIKYNCSCVCEKDISGPRWEISSLIHLMFIISITQHSTFYRLFVDKHTLVMWSTDECHH